MEGLEGSHAGPVRMYRCNSVGPAASSGAGPEVAWLTYAVAWHSLAPARAVLYHLLVFGWHCAWFCWIHIYACSMANTSRSCCGQQSPSIMQAAEQS